MLGDKPAACSSNSFAMVRRIVRVCSPPMLSARRRQWSACCRSSVVLSRSAAIHALTAGAMATMILAVMTRASLGHTGRELKAGAATVVLYALATAGAVLRVTASLQWVDYQVGIEIAGLAWGGALVLFLMAYAPALWKPRLET